MPKLNPFIIYIQIFLVVVVLSACSLGGGRFKSEDVRVSVDRVTLEPQGRCSGRFVPHKLAFANGLRVREIGLYMNNGSGLAINDLDKDGDLDIVFASVDREVGIFWNQGNFEFEEQKIDEKFPRGVAIVDVNGDGGLDLVFSHRGLGGITYWRNLGKDVKGDRFIKDELPGVDSFAYTMAWGDLNGDGLLDLVTGSYNVELVQNGIAIPKRDARAGFFTMSKLRMALFPNA